MKTLKLSLFGTAADVVAIGLGANAYAFHSGGVAECDGCHSMHTPAAGGSFLLQGSDQSSTCLNCHEHAGDTGPSSYHISTAETQLGAGVSPLQRTPGGDFAWLKKTYSYLDRSGATVTEDGQVHGHNIVAADQGYAADSVNTTAPGGTFPASQLACNSCHDPHNPNRRGVDGNISRTGAPIVRSGSYNNSVAPVAGQAVGAFRLLAGAGYTKGSVTFLGNPAAVTPSSYNRTEATTQTRTAYGVSTSGGHETWGQWCSTCHPDMHSTGNYAHPIDQGMGSSLAANYQTYVASGNMTGSSATSFTSLVPFAQNTGDYATLALSAQNNNSVLTGPGSTDQVMCLSCHRAHASGFAEMLRWNNEYEFLTINGAYIGSDNSTSGNAHLGRTSAEWQSAYYDRPATTFATYQRVLCNKCHAKD